MRAVLLAATLSLFGCSACADDVPELVRCEQTRWGWHINAEMCSPECTREPAWDLAGCTYADSNGAPVIVEKSFVTAAGVRGTCGAVAGPGAYEIRFFECD